MIRAALVALGLLFLALPQAAVAQEFHECTDAGYLYHFDPRLAAQDCDEITRVPIHWRGGDVVLRAIHPRSMMMSDGPTFVARLRQTAAEIGAAMDLMGGDLNLSNVTVLFTNYVSPREAATDRDPGFDKGAYEAAAHTLFENDCPVSYYKGSEPVFDGNTFAFVLAHEVFHCIQYRTWADMPDQEWLMEASAEYFAYLSNHAFGAGHIPSFDAEITARPLDNMAYEAVVFYLWLGDVYGPPRVREFLASARSLNGAVNSDMWIEFGQNYFDQRIHLPNGRALPSTPQVGGTRVIHGDDHIEIPAMIPYTLNNAVFSFDRDQTYTLTHSSIAADVRIRWKSGETWSAPPTSVTTCDGEQRFRVIWASTRTTAGGTTEVRAAPASAATCTCPAGVWRETSASLHHYFEQSATGGPGSIEFVGGGRVLQLNPDHTGSFTYEGVITETLPRDDFWVRQTKTGGTHFTWRVVGGRLLTILTPGDNLLNLYNEQHTQRGVIVENRRAGAQSIGHDFSCDAAGLHLRQSAPSPLGARFTVDMDFARAGGGGP